MLPRRRRPLTYLRLCLAIGYLHRRLADRRLGNVALTDRVARALLDRALGITPDPEPHVPQQHTVHVEGCVSPPLESQPPTPHREPWVKPGEIDFTAYFTPAREG